MATANQRISTAELLAYVGSQFPEANYKYPEAEQGAKRPSMAMKNPNAGVGLKTKGEPYNIQRWMADDADRSKYFVANCGSQGANGSK